MNFEEEMQHILRVRKLRKDWGIGYATLVDLPAGKAEQIAQGLALRALVPDLKETPPDRT